MAIERYARTAGFKCTACGGNNFPGYALRRRGTSGRKLYISCGFCRRDFDLTVKGYWSDGVFPAIECSMEQPTEDWEAQQEAQAIKREGAAAKDR